MVRRAVVPTLLAAPLSLAIGWVLDGPGAGATALLGVIVVAANFAAHGLSLAFASRISIGAVHAVALGGVVIRLGVVLVLMLVLRGRRRARHARAACLRGAARDARPRWDPGGPGLAGRASRP